MENCHAITRRGNQCRRHVVPATIYCYQHQLRGPALPERPAPAPPVPVPVVPQPAPAEPLARVHIQIHSPAPVLSPEHRDIWNVLIKGSWDDIKAHPFDFNQPIANVAIPPDPQVIHPLFVLVAYSRDQCLLEAVSSPSVSVKGVTYAGRDLIQLLIKHPQDLEMVSEELLDLRLKITTTFLNRVGYTLNLMTLMHINITDPYQLKCLSVVIKHPRTTLDVSTVSLISRVLSSDLVSIEPYLEVIRCIFSRTDVDAQIEQVQQPHKLLLPYFKFHALKQRILTQRERRKGVLPPPKMWTVWQKIAHQLQRPPINSEQMTELRRYAQLIGYNNPLATPVSLCVALSQHYDHYRLSLTFKHQLVLHNDADLYDNEFSSMPREHIIVDDDHYGFSLVEIPQILKLKKHPYTCKPLEAITVEGVPIEKYLALHPINPIDLLHFMKNDTVEAFVNPDEIASQQLVKRFPHLTKDFCHVYILYPECRLQVLNHLGIAIDSDLSYSDFVDQLIGFMDSISDQSLRDVFEQRIYNILESCQLYALDG
jgi:hypothetical protein